jgi:unsaturated rhamnogalacturonyl hydrolase
MVMVSRRGLMSLALGAGFIAGCRMIGRSGDRASGKGAAYFRAWPQGSEPADVGKRVAQNFLARSFTFQTNPRQLYVIYPEVCAWYGSLLVAALTRDQALEDGLIHKFDYFLTPEGEAHISQRPHVDYRIFGAVPLEIYMRNQQAQYLELGRSLADKQWEHTTADGITTEARYWSDDLYMLPLVQVQAYRATSDPKSLDRAALTMVAYLEKLQQPNGLFLHSADSPFYWSRGNGWVAAGMTEMLISLPENHPQRIPILEAFRKMMVALLTYQAPEGLWRQLIDQEDFWLESSGTGMFAFAMVSGVKRGWLDPVAYGPAARKAWLGLVSYLDESANIREVCVGTNKAQGEVGEDPAVQRKYYFDRPRRVGDLHGQAPVLWTAAALLR